MGSTFQKSGKCHELPRKSITNVTPTRPPHPGVGSLRGKHFKSPGNVMNWRENRYILNPAPHPRGEGFRGQHFKVTKHQVLKCISGM